MAGKEWYILEDFNAGLNYAGKDILALTPAACYEMDNREIKYTILEDFYDGDDLAGSRDKYFLEQLNWIDELDEFLRKKIDICAEKKIELAKGHYCQLVFFIDSLVISARANGEFFKKEKLSSVKYACNREGLVSDYSIYGLPSTGQSLVRQIFLKMCEDNNIPVESIGATRTRRGNSEDLRRNAGLIKNILRDLGGKSVYSYFKYKKYKNPLKTAPRNNLAALFLHAGIYAMDNAIERCLNEGWRVYLKDGGHIYRLDGCSRKEVLDLDKHASPLFTRIKEKCSSVANSLDAGDRLFDWIDEKCGMRTRDLMVKFIRHFIEVICPETLYEIKIISDFLREEKIGFIMARSGTERETIGSFLAGKISGVKRVCFQHGMSPMDWKVWHITELKLNDLYFATDNISESYLNDALKNEYAGDCRVFQSPHYLKFLESSIPGKKLKDDLLLYVPLRVFVGYNCLNCMRYSLTWYFRLQKYIIDLLGKNSGLNVVFKLGSGQRWADESIVKYIQDKGYKNISIKRNDFTKHMQSGARVLMDYPSSALFEAVAMGLPVMSLCYSKFPLWTDARRFFGKSIQIFSSFEEAVKLVENFIDSPKEDYLVNRLKVAETEDFITTLTALRE